MELAGLPPGQAITLTEGQVDAIRALIPAAVRRKLLTSPGIRFDGKLL